MTDSQSNNSTATIVNSAENKNINPTLKQIIAGKTGEYIFL